MTFSTARFSDFKTELRVSKQRESKVCLIVRFPMMRLSNPPYWVLLKATLWPSWRAANKISLIRSENWKQNMTSKKVSISCSLMRMRVLLDSMHLSLIYGSSRRKLLRLSSRLFLSSRRDRLRSLRIRLIWISSFRNPLIVALIVNS